MSHTGDIDFSEPADKITGRGLRATCWDYARRLLKERNPEEWSPQEFQAHAARLFKSLPPPFAGTTTQSEVIALLAECMDAVEYAEGDGPFERAVASAREAETPACAHHHDDPRVRFLIRLCRELADIAAYGEFYLGCRKAGEVCGVDRMTAHRWLRMLCREGIIEVVDHPGTQTDYGRRAATVYRWTGGD